MCQNTYKWCLSPVTSVGRVTKIMRPYDDYFTSTIQFGYNTSGFLTSLTTPIAGTYHFEYDAKGHLVKHVTPMSREYAYTYDNAGRLLETTLPSEDVLSVAYDTAGRLSTITTPERITTYTYDAKGRLGGIAAGTESMAYAYAGDLPVSITQNGVLDHTTTMTYNNLLEPVSLGYAGGTVAYAYDKDGLLVSAGDIEIGRSIASGRVEAEGDGTAATAYEYSGFGEVNLATTAIGTQEFELALTHHATNRRITARSETLDSITTMRQYDYDGLGRLISVRDGDNVLLERYAYDAQGRRVSGNGATYSYNNDDQLLAVSGAAVYEYTANGYRSYRYDGTGGCIGYTYTTGGQLVGVRRYVDDNGDWVLDPTAPAITYTLDAAGRRAAKSVDGDIQERYLWAEHNTTLLAVYGPTGTAPIVRFEYGAGRLPMRMTQGSDTYYFAYDQVGSLRAVFDDTGALVHEITYDSYGNIESEITTQGFESVYIPPFGFAGGLQDRDTGLVLFGFRDYDPETGTWMTPDLICFSGGDTYLYAYCGGDPVNFFDPFGLYEWGAWWEGFKGGTVEGAIQLVDIPYSYFGYVLGKESLADLGYYDPNGPGMHAGRISGEIGICAAITALSLYPFNPFTSSVQQVVRWGGPINEGSWVMTGGATFRNAFMAGHPLRYFTHQPTITTLSRAALRYPKGWEVWKGLLGQRIVQSMLPIFKIAM